IAYMRSQANLDDPDERLRLAKWFHLNRQLDFARAEAKQALAMRPRHTETQQFVKLLELTQVKPARPAVAVELPPLPDYDLSFDSVTAFNLKVQPILMNGCASCHTGSYGGKFRLFRLHEGGERLAG